MNFFNELSLLGQRLLFVALCLLVMACSNASDDNDITDEPHNLDRELRVLIIGNSYADDGTAYLLRPVL